MTSILPTTRSDNFSSSSYDIRSRKHSPALLRRLVRFPQMDFEFALWQMCYLLISPKRVYRNIYYHKQTKNQWSRDDPAFLVLIVSFLALFGAVWGYVYHLGALNTLRTMICMILVDFLLIGSFVSTLTWYIANKFLTENINSYAVPQKVEWAYAFDVHCNSFIPVLLILNVIQLLFLPLLLKDYWASMFVGNLMYCMTLVWYTFGTFLGFNALPFLVHTELFLYPIALCLILFVTSLFGFHIPQYILSFYF
ncbi:UNC-50 [Gilbertella persicaria]|uniref:UNC-50 n=1 Tax=Gilbertella persicaria TaxID=101096 RepID=UPI00221EB6C5|nr:UNC-50 [Gilbertella persicaria]KAI8062827.1 UNC-50 [Gilbertella persicaria]